MAAVPQSMPLLSRGKHKNPSRGACFMEYTALLAGEAFTDAPRCVDGELADVMRHANDTLSDADRSRLVPLLGRSIGLAVRPPSMPSDGRPRRGADRNRYDQEIAKYLDATVALRRAVSARLMLAVGYVPSRVDLKLYHQGQRVDRLFWHLMHEPTVLSTSAGYVSRLVDRLDLLHECYEQAMRELGMPRSAAVDPAAVDVPAHVGAPVR